MTNYSIISSNPQTAANQCRKQTGCLRSVNLQVQCGPYYDKCQHLACCLNGYCFSGASFSPMCFSRNISSQQHLDEQSQQTTETKTKKNSKNFSKDEHSLSLLALTHFPTLSLSQQRWHRCVRDDIIAPL